MKRISITLTMLMAVITSVLAQNAKNIKINEVMTVNTSSIQDEFGSRLPWIELLNTSYSTYNVRNMYITTDTTVLDKNMSVTERVKRMSMIPNGSHKTILSAKEHLILFLNSTPSKGVTHLTARANIGKPTWIALYDGNAIDLIDSITIPAIKENTSFARIQDGADKWIVKNTDAVTPGISNYIQASETKIEKLKREDPNGIGITILCMGIVFTSLILLYLFFLIFGWVADRRSKLAAKQPIKPVVQTAKKLEKVRHVTTNILQDGFETRGRDKEIYIAVISLALKQYLDDVHDIESGTISIKPHNTEWGAHHSFNNSVNRS